MMKLNSCNILYSAWQIQCCGKPFKLGDRVRWSGVRPNITDVICGHKIDFNEEHHGRETLTIEGTITEILSVTAEHPLSENKCYEYDESKVTLSYLNYANGFESEKLSTGEIHHIFWGYIVTLKVVDVTDYNENLQYDHD